MEKDLSRFTEAQQGSYEHALREIRNGQKQSCWMWYIFPQIQGLGMSETARYYAIEDIEEAKAFLADPVLGARLREITEAALETKSDDALAVFGYPDNLKFCSSMTLFALTDGKNPIFYRALQKFFGGRLDEKTVRLLRMDYTVKEIEDPDFGCEGRPDGAVPMATLFLTAAGDGDSFSETVAGHSSVPANLRLQVPDAYLYQNGIIEGSRVAVSADGVVYKL